MELGPCLTVTTVRSKGVSERVAVDNGAVPGVVGALADGVHVAGARGAVQQRASLRRGAAGAPRRALGAPARLRGAPPRAAHLPVPRRRRPDPGRGTQRAQVSITVSFCIIKHGIRTVKLLKSEVKRLWTF